MSEEEWSSIYTKKKKKNGNTFHIRNLACINLSQSLSGQSNGGGDSGQNT